MMTAGVLITNYNTWELALACAAAHRQLHGAALERVVLLDDCSPQPPPDAAPAGVEVIRNEHNLGFSANLNKGVRLVDTELVVIFDADAFPIEPYLATVRAAFEDDPNLGLLGFNTVNDAGEPTASWHHEPGASTLLLGLPWTARLKRWFGERETRVCITTAAMAVRRAAFEEVGGFDERLNWLDVDFDFSMKLNRAPRWTLRVEPSLTARHDYGGTPMSSTDRLIKYYASRWYLLRKYGKLPPAPVARALILARLGVEWLALAVFGRWIYRGDDARRRDKLASRRRLFAYCRENYGGEDHPGPALTPSDQR